jgi:hypothetical protein
VAGARGLHAAAATQAGLLTGAGALLPRDVGAMVPRVCARGVPAAAATQAGLLTDAGALVATDATAPTQASTVLQCSSALTQKRS